ESEIEAALLRREGDLGKLLEVVEGMRRGRTWEGMPNRPLALGKEDLVFYEQKATLEQAMLELDNR
ncbi:MAG TPA: hypothetical protein VKA48_04680, partial [Gammaproteobacteria bacterium]|nr:hypothetical protein [Gammaproteobacteria bacterium]